MCNDVQRVSGVTAVGKYKKSAFSGIDAAMTKILTGRKQQ